MASLWGGRFEKDMDDIVKRYNASIFFDQRMYNEDIDGSIAHVTMLGKQGTFPERKTRSRGSGSNRKVLLMERSYLMWRMRIFIWVSRAV